jgi:hypothetical protein
VKLRNERNIAVFNTHSDRTVNTPGTKDGSTRLERWDACNADVKHHSAAVGKAATWNARSLGISEELLHKCLSYVAISDYRQCLFSDSA